MQNDNDVVRPYGCFSGALQSNPRPSDVNKNLRSASKTSSITRWWNSNSIQDASEEQEQLSEEEFASTTEQVLAHISSELLGLDLETQDSGSKVAKKVIASEKPNHERKLSWPFGGNRKVVPDLSAASGVPSEEGSVSPLASSVPSSTPLTPDASYHSQSIYGTTDASFALSEIGQFHHVHATAAAAEEGESSSTATNNKAPQGYRRLWQSITSVRKGDKVTPTELNTQPQEYTVDSLVRGIISLKAAQAVLEAPRLASGLRTLDSRAVAALLKELSKAGQQARATELFDYLRALPEEHQLAPLADLYTYTTVISQCGGHQHLRRALELVAEMRGKGIQCNVHTYSALMSVCVKCNECELGLDVYEQLLSEGCTPNLVTYNILIDAYSRTGQWAKAADVLEPIARQGLTPEARTYNSIISACGKAGQPAAALRVYERMLSDGVEPTGTTYTSVISAFGRAGQVDEALKMYRDMSARGCEPNVITYSSLISVLERAGRAEAALELFEEMKAAGVRPNVVTFNGLVAACAHSGMWQKAAELVEAMPGAGCRPDGTTYSALVAAFESGGQWRQALQALEKAQAGGIRPDAGVYNAALGALWSSGRLPALAKAVQLLGVAQRQGALRMQSVSGGEATATAYSQGAVILVTLRWLCHFREGLSAAAAFVANPAMRSLLLVRGKHADPNHSFDSTCDALNAMFAAFSVPANAVLGTQGLVINADGRSQLLKDDRAAEVQCGKAFSAVREFENTCKVADLEPEALCTPEAAALRHDIISCITALCGGLQLREDTAHDAVQLCNRLLSLAPCTQQPPAPACAAALLLLACRQAGNASIILRHGQVVLQAAGLPVSAVLEAEQRVLSTLGNDPAAISPLRVLHLYLERLGCDDSSLQKCQLAHVMALTATDLVAKAALSPAFITMDPSLVAAACLYKARQSMGLVPSWPLVLHDMTGYSMEGGADGTGQMNQCVNLMHMLGISS
ncbi:hypothetical protein Ndes2526B_g05894 [Nannochloris sp. 'desiccata']